MAVKLNYSNIMHLAHALYKPRPAMLLLGGACALGLGWAATSALTPSPAAPIESPQAAQTASVAYATTENKEDISKDAAPLSLPATMQLRVSKGDTLVSLLTDTGISFEEAHEAVQVLRRIYDPRKLDIGQQVAVNLDASDNNPEAPSLSRLTLPVSRTATVELARTAKGDFSVKKIEAPLEKALVRVSGKINSSFYVTGTRLGIPANVLSDLIKIYSYDVDFQRDIKSGNTLEVMIERLQTKEGVVAGYGNVVYAKLGLAKRDIAVYRYEDKKGNSGYYNAKGESLRKALLRTPINGARITSRFGLRMHPILGYSKMHRGVDFGAAQGTPIYAAGDGVVAYAGWKGGYGNYVQIKHNDKYATAYGHASRIAAGIKPGKRVKQGQVIAYVGSTGNSTGPHLHYEVLASGQQVNPAGIKFKTGMSLAGADLKKFKAQVGQIQTALAGRGGEKKVAAK